MPKGAKYLDHTLETNWLISVVNNTCHMTLATLWRGLLFLLRNHSIL